MTCLNQSSGASQTSQSLPPSLTPSAEPYLPWSEAILGIGYLPDKLPELLRNCSRESC